MTTSASPATIAAGDAAALRSPAGRESAAPDKWYPIAHMPPRRAEVRLTGHGGYVVTGWHDIRMVAGKRIAWWFERAGRLVAPLERVLLEPTGYRSPTAWQPLDAAAWPHPLPDPLSFGGFGPRWAPPAAPIVAAETPAADAADPVTRFEARLLTAWRVDRALPDTDRAKLRVRSTWPATRPGPGDYPPEQVTRFQPSREQVADYLVVMPHIARLSRVMRRVTRLRADGYGYLAIAHVLRQREGIDQDERHARTLYRRALVACWRSALAAGDAHAS